MTEIAMSSEVLGAMITPAVLISASGVLVLSTSNRVSRTVDRVRALAAEAERLQISPERFSVPTQTQVSKRKLLADQPIAAVRSRGSSSLSDDGSVHRNRTISGDEHTVPHCAATVAI